MTSESKTEDTKTAPIDGASDSPQEPKSIEETKTIQDDSKQESVEKDASDTPIVEEAKEGNAEDSSKPTQQTSSISDDLAALKTNKKNKKVLNPKDLIKTPNKHDVLLGRGKPFQNHDGNQAMLRIVDMYRKRYHESERAFKHEIIEEVLDIIKSKGGRFLERIDDFEKSYWSVVPHRMSYRKVGHAFRSNARRISMEKRGQAANQRRNASAMARASLMSQFLNNNENLMQRMPLQGASLQDMIPVGGSMGLTDAMGIGGSLLNDSNGLSSYRQGAGTGLNPTQRELLAHEQMLHSSRIERILGGNNSGLGQIGSQPSNVQSLLGGDSLSLGAANLAAERSLQINNMRRMMLLGSGGVANHPNAYQLGNGGASAASRLSNMGLSNIGGLGDPSFK